jgi:hypothetical protein
VFLGLSRFETYEFIFLMFFRCLALYIDDFTRLFRFETLLWVEKEIDPDITIKGALPGTLKIMGYFDTHMIIAELGS